MLKNTQSGISKSVVIVIVGLVLVVVVAIVVAVVFGRGSRRPGKAPSAAVTGEAPVSSSGDESSGGSKSSIVIEGLNERRQLTEDEIVGYGFFEGSTVYGTPRLDDVGTVYMEFDVVSAPQDSDGDRLTDADEQSIGSDPNKADTDGDGLDDRSEVEDYGTDPRKADTDGDGYSDKEEVELKRDPKNASR